MEPTPEELAIFIDWLKRLITSVGWHRGWKKGTLERRLLLLEELRLRSYTKRFSQMELFDGK